MAEKARADGLDAATLDYGMLGDLLGYGLRRAQLRVFQDFAETMAPFDISPGQLGVLLLVEANRGLNQSSLAKAMGLNRSTIVAVLDHLENRNLVRRAPCPDDRRSYALLLTDNGSSSIADLRPHLEQHEARLSKGLTPDERKTLIGLLKRINGL